MGIKKNKKQTEGSSHFVRDVPDGTKLEIRKKSGKSKKQTTIPEIKLSDVPMSNQKIPSPEEGKIQPDKFLYVYGITNNGEIELDFKGLKDQPIQKFEIKDLMVLFSFYPALHPLVEEKEALLHAEILNKLTSRITIVPMAFGTVFKDQDILKIVLSKSYPLVKKTLELIKDKFELGVKVIKKNEVLGGVNREILEELNKLSVKSVEGDKFSERLLLNHSFLVGKNNFTQFSDKIGELEQKYPDLKFLYTGPWPAYSFVNININAG